jgi:N-acetylglucosamine-6-phosphate deacetylase
MTVEVLILLTVALLRKYKYMSEGAAESANVTIIRGNIVTPKGVLYGGFIEVTNDLITLVAASDVPLPTVESKRKQFGDRVALSFSSADSQFVIPGFVDIHNHGVGGCDEVCDHWIYPEVSQKYLARCGTLSTLASVIFSKARPEMTKKVVETIETRVGKVFEDCCVIEGVHAEGPVIADQGGLPPTETEPTLDDFKALCATMPSMKIMTISPSKEARVNYERLKHLLDIGVRPSLGHDRVATEQDILGALKLVKSPEDRMHTTHMCNVMSFHHREPSLINFNLCSRLPRGTKYNGAVPPTLEMIADFIHVHPVVVQSVLSARDPADIAIISDCISSYEPGKRLKYNGRSIAVRAEGGAYLCDPHGRPTKTLAGSTVTLADQFFSLLTHFSLDVTTACLLLATTPAKIARIADRVGSLEVGKRANILLVNGEMNTIQRRMVYGNWVNAEPYRMLRPSPSHL